MEKEKIANSTIYNQVRTIFVQGIVVALLLSLGANLFLSLRQENSSRDQTLTSAAQVAANAPIFMDNIDTKQANTYIKRTVESVSSIDVLAVYDLTQIVAPMWRSIPRTVLSADLLWRASICAPFAR